jgi:hypothetical protein
MTNAARWFSLALLGGLAGCSLCNPRQEAAHGNPVPCNPGTCEITVKVNGDCRNADNITVDPPFVSVDSARNMRWTIATPGHEFTADGIRFDPPNAQFEPRHSPRPNEFHLHDRKSENGDFYYWVNLKGCAPKDPWVRNN